MSYTQDVGTHIRWMIRRDMDSVLDIESECFDMPWGRQDFTECLTQTKCIGYVSESDSEVNGYMVYLALDRSITIQNFAVRPSCRRLGIGSSMINKLKEKLSFGKRTRIDVIVRETNLPAQLFFKSLGFKASTVFRKHWNDPCEDAYLMQFNKQG